MLQNLFNYLGKIASLKDDIKKKILQVLNEDPGQHMFNYFNKFLLKDLWIKAVNGETDSVIIPENCHDITYAFRDVTTLKKVTFEGSPNNIGGQAFYNATALDLINSDIAKTINLPEGISGIDTYAFAGISSSKRTLTDCKIIFPLSILTISNEAFRYCNALSMDFSKCVNLKSIGSNFGYSCPKIKILDFSNCTLLTEIKFHTEGMTALETLILPPNIEKIGSIRLTTKLTYVKMPDTLMSIGGYSLGYDPRNTGIIFDFGNTRTTIPTVGNSKILEKLSKAIVPDALYDDWILATNWSAVASKIVKYSDYYN